MPHPHLPYIYGIKEHFTLVGLTTYAKRNSDPSQTIRNVVLSTLDFVHSAHPVDHRTRNCLTPQGSSCTSVLHATFGAS